MPLIIAVPTPIQKPSVIHCGVDEPESLNITQKFARRINTIKLSAKPFAGHECRKERCVFSIDSNGTSHTKKSH